MKKYYAGYNLYGTNVSYKSMGWAVKAFDTVKERDAWVRKHWCDENGNNIAEIITYKDARDILGAGNWVEYEGWMINEKDDPRW